MERAFKGGEESRKKREWRKFVSDLQWEFSEPAAKKRLEIEAAVTVPRLQHFAVKIKNFTNVVNSMDKKYQKCKEEAKRKRQMMLDASALDSLYLNYDVAIKNFCENMQLFQQFNTNKDSSAQRIVKVNGFNSTIRSLVFDDNAPDAIRD